MKKRQVCISILALLALIALGIAQTAKETSQVKTGQHVMMTPDEVKWETGPPSLPAGAQIAVIKGDLAKAGAYTFRAKLPAGYKVPPHWHPVDEHVTVLSGTVGIGMGEKFDQAAGRELPPGSFVVMPKQVRHYAWAKDEVVIQFHGTGPWGITYVNPADDPRKQAARK
jgi:mannose-6-phosphate isomerase-like protein (cupin superfamily)